MSWSCRSLQISITALLQVRRTQWTRCLAEDFDLSWKVREAFRTFRNVVLLLSLYSSLTCFSVPHVRVDRQATPKVHVLLPAGVQKQRSERVTLACVITGLQSKAVRITWKVNGATGLKKHTSSPQVLREPGGTFSAVGLYSVRAHKWSGEDRYRCEVTYKAAFHYGKAESSLCSPPEGL